MNNKYYVSKVDEGVWMVIDSEGDGLEYCICSDFEEGKQDAEKRANAICSLLNGQENAKFVVMDVSEDFGKGSYGVNLNELHEEEDYAAVNVWDDLDDAIFEKNELDLREVAGTWEVFSIVPVEGTDSLSTLDEDVDEKSF